MYRVPSCYNNDDSDDDSDESSQPPRAKKSSKAPLREKQLNDLFVLPPRPQPINCSSSAAAVKKKSSANHREVTVVTNDEHPVTHILSSYPQSTDPGPQIIDEPLDAESVTLAPSAELVSESSMHSEPFPTASEATTVSSSVNPNDTQGGPVSPATAASPGVTANIIQSTPASAATATPSGATISLTKSRPASVDQTSYRISRCVSGTDN